MRLTNLAAAASAVALVFAAPASHAAVLFIADPAPAGTAVNIDNHKDSPGTLGTVLSPNDVTIAVIGNADFASGNATIKPLGGKAPTTLTDLLFTPKDPTAFNGFSFRGQDLAANQTIIVTVTDQKGVATSIDFTESAANADFSRIGIIAAITGETIRSVEIHNSGGFKQAKQFEFDAAPAVTTGGVPEPATWGLMLVGFAGLGSALRAARRTATVA